MAGASVGFPLWRRFFYSQECLTTNRFPIDMKVDLHITILRNPQVGSSIRSSICFSFTKNNGRVVGILHLEGIEYSSCLIPEGHYSGRVVFSSIWNSPIILIDANCTTLSILHRCSFYIGLDSTPSDCVSDCDKALYMIEAFLKSYEVESVDVDICNEQY